MNDKEKNIVAKLEIIKELSNNNDVKQLADVVKEYIVQKDKKGIGFKDEPKTT